jgi:hypothetical protein
MGRSGLPLLGGSSGFIGSLGSLPLTLPLCVSLTISLSVSDGRKKKTRGRKKKKIRKEKRMILISLSFLCSVFEQEGRTKKRKE